MIALPLKTGKEHGSESIVIVDSGGNFFASALTTDQHDFIVKACNMHHALVTALDEARRVIGNLRVIATTDVLDEIDTLLKEAR